MSAQKFRTPAPNGILNRDRTLDFTFDGKSYVGYVGDTLASALLANGVKLVGRSFKYHRPRGIFGSGLEDPNAWVVVGQGALEETNVAATTIELYDGLVARSVNSWPNVTRDAGSLIRFMSAMTPAGFYYKTFMKPARLWPVYERIIRRIAGVGRVPGHADTDVYEHVHAQADILVVGAGPAGLAAAREAALAGVDVLLIDDQPRVGGSLFRLPEDIDGQSGAAWAQEVFDTLSQMENVRILTRTTVFGHYDHGQFVGLERLTDHLPERQRAGARQRLWKIRAERSIIATGSHERPLMFENNDLPGVMLASAARGYANAYSVRVGHKAVVVTCNDGGYAAALDLIKAGASVEVVIDTRPRVGETILEDMKSAGIQVCSNASIVKAKGKRSVSSVTVSDNESGKVKSIDCDIVAVAGGWSPTVHLFSQVGGHLEFDQESACIVPMPHTGPTWVAGSANGHFSLSECINDGADAGALAATCSVVPNSTPRPRLPRNNSLNIQACFKAHSLARKARCFVDMFGDVSIKDIDLAAREGYGAVEHMKRYTTTGMGIDQGKTGNVNAIAILGDVTGREISAVGTTTYRPPYSPVSFGALMGTRRDHLVKPMRKTSIDACHVEHDAVFENFGQWRRPAYYARGGASMAEAVHAEAQNVRRNVGIVDVSTLGKIHLHGPDVGEFLNRIYTNRWDNLKSGRCRYGVMLSDDGMVMDDGVTARISELDYHMTTTSGGAPRVYTHLDDFLTNAWPDLRVKMTSVTTQWSSVAIAGPNARTLLARVLEGNDESLADIGFMDVRLATVCGIPARVFGISFTGEMSFEINVPASYGASLWRLIMATGRELGVQPFGVEAMDWLRAEKGHFIVGRETDGTVTPYDLGLNWIVNAKKGDFVGKRGLQMENPARKDRLQLVGLVPNDPKILLPEGAQIVSAVNESGPSEMIGHVTTSVPALSFDHSMSLALLKDGQRRHGDQVKLWSEGEIYLARVTSPHFYDPSSERLKG